MLETMGPLILETKMKLAGNSLDLAVWSDCCGMCTELMSLELTQQGLATHGVSMLRKPATFSATSSC